MLYETARFVVIFTSILTPIVLVVLGFMGLRIIVRARRRAAERRSRALETRLAFRRHINAIGRGRVDLNVACGESDGHLAVVVFRQAIHGESWLAEQSRQDIMYLSEELYPTSAPYRLHILPEEEVSVVFEYDEEAREQMLNEARRQLDVLAQRFAPIMSR